MWKNSMRARYHRAAAANLSLIRYATYRISKEPPLTSVLAPPKRILTVEDNTIVSADVRTILEAAGYDVLPEARDGVQAVEHVHAYAPDLILLDLALPRLDGIETANRIRSDVRRADPRAHGLGRSGDARARRCRGRQRPRAQAVQRERSARGGAKPPCPFRVGRLRLAPSGRGHGARRRGRADDRACAASRHGCGRSAARGDEPRRSHGGCWRSSGAERGVQQHLARALPGAVNAWKVCSALSRPTAPSISAALGIRPSASNSMAAPKSARP